MKVLVVVVTRNRCDLLIRCIDHLQAQTCSPDAILVANNASTDNMVELLERRSIPFATQENVGSAGDGNSALNTPWTTALTPYGL